MNTEAITQLINFMMLPIMGLIFYFLRTFLAKAIGEMKADILEAIDVKYTRTDVFDRMEKEMIRRLVALERPSDPPSS